MFKLIISGSKFINHCNDIATLEDIALGYLDNENEARRVAVIASNMKLEEVFATKTWSLVCVEESRYD